MKTTSKLEREVRALRLLAEGHRILLSVFDEGELMAAICHALVEGGYKLAFVGYAREDKTVVPIAIGGAPADYVLKADIRWDESEKARGPTGSAIRTGLTQVNSDFDRNPALKPWRERARQAGLRSSLAIALKFDGGQRAALTIYSDAPAAFGPAEIEVLEQLAADIVRGVNDIRLHAAQNAALEDIRKDDILINSILETSPDGIAVIGPDQIVKKANKNYAKIWNVQHKVIEHADVAALAELLSVHTLDPDAFKATVSQSFSGDRDQTYHTFVTLKDGRFLERISSPIHGPTGDYLGRVSFARDITGQRATLVKLKRWNRWLAALAIGLVLLGLIIAAWPFITRAIIGPQAPDVFGSTAVRIRTTSLDAKWALVADVTPPRTPAINKLETEISSLPTLEQVRAVNRWVNHTLALANDPAGEDRWQTLAETLRTGQGDCEDYAIAKMQLLKAAGVPASSIYLIVAKDLVRRADHALLAVQVNGEFWILDNATDEVMPQEAVKDYSPLMTFTSGGKWIHGYRTAAVDLRAADDRPEH